MSKRNKGKRNRRNEIGMSIAPVAVLSFRGEVFAVADRLGLMPLLRFAHLAKKGVDSDDMEGLVAIYDLLQNVIADADWERFEAHATAERATGEDLMVVVTQAIEAITARPTERPSDSSDGSTETSPSSPDDSTSRVIRRLEREGRPSIALMVRQRAEAASSASA